MSANSLSVTIRWVISTAIVLLSSTAHAERVLEERIDTEYQPIRLVEVVSDLENPWAVAFLPDGGLLVTERAGRLLHIHDGERTVISGLPEIHAQGQGGLLDVVVHPQYEENGWIYLTYAKGDQDGTVPALIRGRLDDGALVDVDALFESSDYTAPGRHYGSRLLFLDDETLLMTIGDRGGEPPRAQDTQDHSGSVVRLHADGRVPDDNPFVGDDTYLPEIFSYGHRNIQGIALHPVTGEIWATEHGPRGGDELNRIEAGGNYGWPVVTLGRDYRTEDEFPDAQARTHEDMVDPVFEILPTFAPSGLAIVEGERFPAWTNNLLAGGLRAERILRFVVDNDTVIHAEELLLGKVGRIRDVRQSPSGDIYVLSDASRGGLYRMEPAD